MIPIILAALLTPMLLLFASDADAQTRIARLPNVGDTWLKMDFSPDGQSLAVSEHGKLRVYDIATGEISFQIPMPHSIEDVVFGPEGRFVAVGMGPDGARIIDITDQASPVVHELAGDWHQLTTTRDGEIVLGTKNFPSEVGAFGATWNGRKTGYLSLAPHISVRTYDAQGKAAAGLQRFHLDISDRKRVEGTIPADRSKSTFAALYQRWQTEDYALIYSDIDDPGSLKVANLPGSTLPKLMDFRETEAGPRAVLWLQTDTGGRFVVYDSVDDSQTFKLDYEQKDRTELHNTVFDRGAYRRSTDAVISRDGLRVAVLASDDAVEIFATDDAENPETLLVTDDGGDAPPVLWLTQGHDGQLAELVLSPDGKVFATRGADWRVHLWDRQTGRQLRTIADGDYSSQISFSPDGKTVAMASQNDGIELWDVDRGTLHTLLPHSQTYWAAFLGDGDRLIACGTADCTIGTPREFRDSRTRVIALPNPPGYTGFARGSLSPDGRIAALLLGDDHLLLVDVENARMTYAGTVPNASSIALGTDGHGLLGLKSGGFVIFDSSTGDVSSRHEMGGDRETKVSILEGETYVVEIYGTTPFLQDDEPGEPPTRLIFDLATNSLSPPLPTPDGLFRTNYPGPAAYDPDSGQLFLTSQSNSLENNARIDVLDLERRQWLRRIETQSVAPRSLVFSGDGSSLIVDGARVAATWDLLSGRASEIRPSSLFARSFPAGDAVVYFAKDGSGDLMPAVRSRAKGEQPIAWDRPKEWYSDISDPGQSNGREVLFYTYQTDGVHAAIFDLLAVGDGQSAAGRALKLAGGAKSDYPDYLLSPSGMQILGHTAERLVAFDAATGGQLWEMRSDEDDWRIEKIAYSPDGSRIYALRGAGTNPLEIYDAATGKLLPSPQGSEFLLAISAYNTAVPLMDRDTRLVLLDTGGAEDVASIENQGTSFRLAHLDAATGQILVVDFDKRNLLWNPETGTVHLIEASIDGAHGIAFSPDGSLLALVESMGLVSLWRTETGERMARLAMLRDGGWAVIANDGRYDSSDPGDFPSLSWVLPDAPTDALPLELFYREFFEPSLLPRLIGAETFDDLPDLRNVNRLQPDVRIVAVEADPAKPLTASATVEVTETTKDDQTSGLGMIKLFRDGQLVGQKDFEDGASGQRTVRFDDILLPEAGADVVFSAYAFNLEGIKSQTVRSTFRPAQAEDSTAVPTAYVVSIGVDHYANSAWDLNYAGADARLSADALTKRLKASGEVGKVVSIELISTSGNAQPMATKAQVEAVLQVLGGDRSDPAVLAQITGAEALSRARPEDFVFLFFAGHGLAGSDGRFHLFTSDFGEGRTGRTINSEALQRTLDSDRLSQLFLRIQAGDMVVVIDACNSAASVEGSGFKPGPMGSRGLGQIAYDKGMRILTASQAEGVALESDVLRHGALSYAMFREGLEGEEADRSPVDSRISFAELLGFAASRVPTLYEEIVTHNFKPNKRGSMTMDFVADGEPDQQTYLARFLQHPSLFDFSGRNRVDPIYLPSLTTMSDE